MGGSDRIDEASLRAGPHQVERKNS